MPKLFTVFGSTGNQGGSVIKSILEHPQLSKEYKLRGVTRDVSRPAAEVLRAKGVETVSANLDDPQSVKKAIEGSAVVFGVTNFWEKLNYDIEVAQGKSIVDAAKAAGVERLIWSTLINVNKESGGKITTVLHFDSKSAVDEYIRKQGVPTSYYMPGPFSTFILKSFYKNDQGVYVLSLPIAPDAAKIPIISPADDSGLFVAAMLLHGDSTIGMRVQASAGYVSPNDLVKGFTEATGQKAQYNQVTFQQFHDMMPAAVAEELADTYKLIDSPGYYAGEPKDGLEKSLALVKSAGLRAPTTWVKYVKENFKH